MIKCGVNVLFCAWNLLSSFLIPQGVSAPLKYLSAFAVQTTLLAFDYTLFCVVFKCVFI